MKKCPKDFTKNFWQKSRVSLKFQMQNVTRQIDIILHKFYYIYKIK